MTSHVWGYVQDWIDAQIGHVSQRRLADLLGVSSSLVHDWKTGKSSPSPEAMRALSELIGVPEHRLIEAINRDQGYLPPVADRTAG